MSTNQTTADNTQHAGQHTGKLTTISNKIGGLGNIIRGTGQIIHGHVPGVGDPARGGNAAIKTAGRQEVERGLDRIDGKPTITSAAGGNAPAQDWERSRVGDGNGAAPTTAPQASTTAPRADDLTSQKDRGAAADIRHHPVDSGAAATTATAGAAVAGTQARGHDGPTPEQRYRDDGRTQAAATTAWAPPHDRPFAANGPAGVQRDADMRQQQQGNETVAGGRDKLDQESAATTSPSDYRDTDVHQQVQGNGEPAAGTSDARQQGNGFASSDRDKAHWQETRTTADTSDPVNTAVGQERPSGTVPQA